jgi:hypothetical protein
MGSFRTMTQHRPYGKRMIDGLQRNKQLDKLKFIAVSIRYLAPFYHPANVGADIIRLCTIDTANVVILRKYL